MHGFGEWNLTFGERCETFIKDICPTQDIFKVVKNNNMYRK